ncbi:MAG: glutamate synthase large subunit [Proteobacteria bacterium]|nr:glutamate synthase large subunit [Pseudomonadota bacterium]
MTEKDSCGVGFISNLKNIKSYDILAKGIEAVKNLTHRGAVGSDGKTGDGCGILFEIPDKFFRDYLKNKGINTDEFKNLAIGVIFSKKPIDIKNLEDFFRCLGFPSIYKRDVPVNLSALGDISKTTLPCITQIIILHNFSKDEAEKRLFITERLIEKTHPYINIVSLSSYSIVYKGMLIAPYLDTFYPDLKNEEFATSYCVFHQRYSTNTMPKWELAQPFGFIAHNGEINTIKANRFKFKTLEEKISLKDFADYYEKICPLLSDEESDSASLDKVFRLLVLNGYSTELAINLLIPPAWENLPFVDRKLQSFFQYNELICEPWDGPSAIIFCDGKTIGAHLDRNGLRPLRYSISEDGIIVVGSESGMVEFDTKIIKEGKLNSGDTLSLNISKGVVRTRMEILRELSLKKNFEKKLSKSFKKVDYIEDYSEELNNNNLQRLKTAFAYTKEEIEEILPFAGEKGMEFTYSMGDDTPLPPLAKNPPLLFRYFKQKFAQVTNPPIDPIREKQVMSLTVFLGERGNLLNYEEPSHTEKLALKTPILSKGELNSIKSHFQKRYCEVSTIFSEDRDIKTAIKEFCKKVETALMENKTIIVLTDKDLSSGHYYIPSLLALSVAVNLARNLKLSHKTNFIIQSGEVRDSHHISSLLAFGASAVYPYLAYEIVREKGKNPQLLRIAYNYGLQKIISKMGISCVNSYIGSKLFDIICLDKNLVEEFFPDTDYSLNGSDLEDIFKNHKFYVDRAFKEEKDVITGGDLRFIRDGEWHGWSPMVVSSLNKFLKSKNYDDYIEYTKSANIYPTYIRDLLDFERGNKVSIEEVESEENILKRFATGGMSIGALSPEAHSTIVSSANILGMKCNSGEGGEDTEKYWTKSGTSIKQVASGRFGVTPDYLASAEEIEIKIAQGAKPGEGGQLPGSKVSAYIAKLRHSQEGITLISPPPHHDIYSIEDLAQLINDLKNINPKARIGVKLVSERGIGQIACGVAKANADFIQISSVDGGTGASPYVSIKNAGSYWELGLSEVHLSLIENGLRDKVTLRVDGGLKTGRDIIISALLGADEFAFGTLSMLAVGCIMDRKCHLNSCSVGVATQEEHLRKRFRGNVDNFCLFFKTLAGEVRELLSQMGFRKLEDIIGRAYLLKKKNWESYPLTKKINPEEIIRKYNKTTAIFCKTYRTEPSGNDLNIKIANELENFIKEKKEVVKIYKIKNTDRSVPVRASYLISHYHKGNFTKDDIIKIRFEGTSGQSFGAFCQKGLYLELIGVANDYVGKGMSGGKIVIRSGQLEETNKNYLAGNTLLYGATGGELYIAGRVGERFAVRNSGAIAVVEGAGHHLCEYMTGGTICVIGGVGLNVGAGMTGGTIYIYDEPSNLDKRINKDYVKMDTLTENDEMTIIDFLTRHYFYTHSKRALDLLENWHKSKEIFKKVIPLK